MILAHILFYLLLIKGTVRSQEDDDEEETPSVRFGECGGAVLISEEENATYILSSPFNLNNSKLYNSSNECKYELIGDPKCTVQIKCSKMDLAEPVSRKCSTSDEHLEIWDGTGGSEIFCRNFKFEWPIIASKDLHDLYVTFKASDKPNVERGGFKCEVTCATENSQGRPLKITKKRKENQNCVCGMKQKAKLRKKRVVNGFDAGLNEWPWQVAMVKPGTRTSFCGGAILNSRYILCAAHCFYFQQVKPDEVEVLLHARQLDRTDRKELRSRNPDKSGIAKYREKLQKILTKTKLGDPLQNMSGPGLQNISGSSGGIKLPPMGGKPPNVNSTILPLTNVKPTIPKLPGSLENPPAGSSRSRRSAEKQKGIDIGGIGKPKNSSKAGSESVQIVKNITDKDEKTKRFKVRKITTHPLFTISYDFDVAVVELENELDLKRTTHDDHTSLCLPKLGYEERYVDDIAWVVGWGLQKEDDNVTDGVLHQLNVIVMNTSRCQNWTEFEITPRMMCAGYEKGQKDACVGDSGGPLSYQNKKGQWSQIGIVSWGEGCAKEQKPGMYARVTELNQWIHHHTLENGKWCKNTIDDGVA